MTDKTDALVARLRMHARDCVSAADIDTDTVLSAAQIDDMADALNEAAEALAAPAASVDASKIMEVVERYAGKTASATKYIRQDLLKLIDSAGGVKVNEPFGNSEQLRQAAAGFLAASFYPDGDGHTDDMRQTYSYWHKRLLAELRPTGAMEYAEAEAEASATQLDGGDGAVAKNGNIGVIREAMGLIGPKHYLYPMLDHAAAELAVLDAREKRRSTRPSAAVVDADTRRLNAVITNSWRVVDGGDGTFWIEEPTGAGSRDYRSPREAIDGEMEDWLNGESGISVYLDDDVVKALDEIASAARVTREQAAAVLLTAKKRVHRDVIVKFDFALTTAAPRAEHGNESASA